MVRIKHRYLLIQILYPDPIPLSSKPDPRHTSSKSHPPSSAVLPTIVRFHQPSPNELTPQVLVRAIRDQIALLYGDYGVGVTASSLNGKITRANVLARAHPKIVKYLSPATSTAIVRCARAHYRLVWAALSFMTQLPGSSSPSSTASRPCVFRVVRVSGTIKKCEEEAIKQARAAILRAKREEGGGNDDEGGLLHAVLGPFEEDPGTGEGNSRIGIEDSDVEHGEMESHSDGE
ncbi:hypothetical protein MMC22_008197 [Lobaria immixta]|nr:hypothetical protein [Lobaria immixta]